MSHHGLPPNPMKGPSPSTRDVALPPHDPPSGFSRSGFAPLPHRHSDHPPLPQPPQAHDERDWDRGRGGGGGGQASWRDDVEHSDRWAPRDDWDRRPPPPRWEDDFDRPKRRRSPSPFGSSHRPRHHSPSPPPSRYPPPPSSQFIDPAELPNSLTFRQFADWFRASHPQTARADEEELKKYRQDVENGLISGKERIGMAKRYERYRKEYHSRQLYALYLTHRESPWFLERYSNEPAYVSQRRRVNRQGRVPTAERYLDALRSGEHDNVSYDLSDSDKRASGSRANDEPEGLDRALGDAPVDDSLRVEVPPAQRQVFVKTVPPHTGRKELEELFRKVDGFEYLALTEPAMKKSFHRVGWAQFAPGVDVQEVVRKLDNSKIDNFIFHMGVNATPVVGKIRLTAPVANTLERLQQDAEKAKALAQKIEDELLGDDEPKDVNGAGKEGEEEKKDETKPHADGELGLRQSGVDIVQDKINEIFEREHLNGEDLDEEQKIRKTKIALDQWISYLRHGLSTCYYCVAAMAFPEELHRKCISHMRPHPTTQTSTTAINEIPEAARGTDREEEDQPGKDEHDVPKRDRYEEEEDRREEEDATKPHRGRKVLTALRSEDEKWAESLDGKLRAVLDPDPDVTEFGGRDIEEETQKLCAPMIKQEEASKYRCKECNKLFKAPEFVVKHIASKHPEITKTKLDEISTFNNYVLDPQRIQPGPTVLAAVNDALPATLPLSMPPLQFTVAPSFNPAFTTPAGASGAGGGPGMDRMMQQQMMMMMQMQQAMMLAAGNGTGMAGATPMAGPAAGGGGGGPLGERIGGFADTPLGPPPGGEDPRAKRGRVSYLDLDEPGGGGDSGLPY